MHLFGQKIHFIFVTFTTHLIACWFCTASTVQHPCFHFFTVHDIFCLAECTHTDAGVLWHVPRQIIKSSAASNNTIMFMCVFLLWETLAERAQSRTGDSAYPHAVRSDWMRRLICISNQIIVLMPIRSITSGEHEDITTPTYSKWWRRFAWHTK